MINVARTLWVPPPPKLSIINNNFFERNVNIISKNRASKTKSFKIKTITFDQVLSKNSKIDYLSIDIEGGEMALLNSINFNDYEIKVISVENNIPEKQNFKNFFDDKNFTYFDRVGQDEIFYNNKFFKF